MRLPSRRAAGRRTEPAGGLDASGLLSAGIGPDSVEVGARHLRLADAFAASLIVTGYPAEVAPGWLEPLLTYPGRLDVSLHIEPIEAQLAASRLRKQRARLESGRRSDAQKGRLADPEAEAAAQDAADLAYRIARGEGKLFRVGLYLTVYAPTKQELEREVGAVRALASSLLITTVPASYRAVAGWTSCLPLGVDALGVRRTFDTQALAAAFPFTSPDLTREDPTDTSAPGGVLYGANAASSGLVMWDRFAQDNHNSVVLARSGAGKSYLTKLEILRSLYLGIDVFVIDPEDEYRRLADAVGAAYLNLGAAGVRLNPFDLPASAAGGTDGNGLLRRALFLHTFISVLLGSAPDPGERAALDRAVLTAYARAGITTDPRTWVRPAPILADLADALLQDADPAGPLLSARLEPFTRGSYAGLFDGPTSTKPEGHLVLFSLRDLPDELKTVGTLLVLDTIWRQVTNPAARRRSLVVVDEAWLLMRDPEGARFLFRMAKAARKHWAGLAVVTQDAADVLGTDLGRAIVANSATQILLRQAPQALDAVAAAFHLSAGERELLATAERGVGLLAAGAARVAFQTVASDLEHTLATTSPAELADLYPDPAEDYFTDPHDTADPHPVPAFSTAGLDDPDGDLL